MSSTQTMTDEQMMKLARKRVKRKQAFKIHLICFILVNVVLLIIFFSIDPQNYLERYFWPKWPLMGWSVGLFFHGLAVFSNVFSGSSSDAVMKEYRKLKDAAGPDAKQ